jgi:hypothetical protein
MKNIYLIVILWLYSLVGFAQQPTDVTPQAASDGDTISAIISPLYTANPQGYLSKLDKSLFPTGILIDRTKFRTDIHEFNGDDRVKTCSFFIWKQLFENLSQSGNDTLMLPQYDAIKEYLIGMGRYQNTYIIPILNMQFNTIDKQAYERGDFTETDSFLVSSGATKASFLTNRLLTASPFAGRIHGNDATFMIDSNLYISNIPTETLQTIEADFDDGSGWQTLQWNNPITVSYGADSRWVMAKLRISLKQMILIADSIGRLQLISDSIIQRFVHFNFLHTGTDLVPEPAAISDNTDSSSTLKSNRLKDYDEGGVTWNAPISNILHFGGNDPARGSTVPRKRTTKYIFNKTTLMLDDIISNPTGSTINRPNGYYTYVTKGTTITFSWTETNGIEFDYNILWGAGNNSGRLRKPMIIVDGFDPGNTRDYYQTVQPNPVGDIKTDDYRGLYELMNGEKSAWSKDPGATLCANLKTSGYDLIFINWTTGDGDIPTNAGYLREFLKNSTVGPNSSTLRDNQTEEMILVGPSMGGLITRYCLTEMEAAGEEPHVKLWFSFDSPQEGAYIPIALQWQVKYLSDLQPDNASLASGIRSLTSAAAKQMLLYHFSAFKNNGEDHSDQPANHMAEFDNLYNHFHALQHPYPQFSKNIAISNGGTKKLYNESVDNQICRFKMEMTLNAAMQTKNFQLNATCAEIIAAANIWGLGFGLTCLAASNLIHLKFSTRGYRNHNIDGTYKIFSGTTDNFDNSDNYTFNTTDQIGFEIAPGGYNTALYDFNQNKKNDDKPSTDVDANPQTAKACFMPTTSAFGVAVTQDNVYKTHDQYVPSDTPFDFIYGTSKVIAGVSDGSNEEHVRVSNLTSEWLQTYVEDERKSIQKPYRSGVTETESKPCLYTAVNSVTFGGQLNSTFTVKAGADVQATAPHIKFQPGFKVDAGAHFKATPSTVVNGLKSMVESPVSTSTQQQPTVSYLTASQYNNKVYDYSTNEPIFTQKTNTNRNVTIYPNPAADELFVDCSDSCAGLLQVTITNVLGIVVKTSTINATSKQALTIADLSIGVYFVQVQCNNKLYSFKLIKE